jgi:hypothetical protein
MNFLVWICVLLHFLLIVSNTCAIPNNVPKNAPLAYNNLQIFVKLLKGSAERLTRNHIKIRIPETTKALKAINFLTMSFAGLFLSQKRRKRKKRVMQKVIVPW